MALAIRDVKEQDLDAVLALNNGAGDAILTLDRRGLDYFFEHADYFRVAEIDGQLAGFLIALRENVDYDSCNYRWFARREPEFVYIDRIVIAPYQRGIGLGRVFYCDVQSYAEVRVPSLTCEVFLEPRNDAALLFHGSFGFNEIGQQRMPHNNRRVSLLCKPLPSYAYVRDRYLRHGGLPDVPWLQSRALPAAATTARHGGNGH
ncbi:MAG TPA: GNAT family N-acetyltransferase [Rhodanobacteraceae bacterium]|nr:GNAT family N-acetyltransferase [Rhodanobacteraceae bacterium]